MASTADSMVPKAVMTMTWVAGALSSAPRRTSMPSTAPMRRSVSTTSKLSDPSRWMAAAPSSASTTSWPACRSRMAVVARMFFWSSTTSTRPPEAAGGWLPAVWGWGSMEAPSQRNGERFSTLVSRRRTRRLERDADGDHGARALAARHRHLPPVPLHDALHHRQARAVVADLHPGPAAVPPGAHRELPAPRHGLHRVHGHVEHRLAHQARVDGHRGQVGLDVALHGDAAVLRHRGRDRLLQEPIQGLGPERR